MKILVINSGSSSIKFQLWNMDNHTVLCTGLIERIGLDDGIFNYRPDEGETTRDVLPIPNHTTGIKLLLDRITDKNSGVIPSIEEISAVGHRIVHGGDKITKSELMTPEIIQIVKEASSLAPLHNPPNLAGIEAIEQLLPGIPNVGVFDTAFHSTMPPEAYIYPLDYKYYTEHGIRRFGFHGTSHNYVALQGAKMLGIAPDKFNCVTCHMGNGVSLTAVKNGKSVDTTLGFGTMCGVMMGTRAGDLDPAIILHLQDVLGMSTKEVNNLIYKESGLKGISGLSNDARDVDEAAQKGNERAILALKLFAHGARKYIAALASDLGGRLDAIIFTAGIGENSINLRKMCCQGLEVLGAYLDTEKNTVRGKQAVISTTDSPVKILVVPTNEELMIAMDTERIVKAL
ncbi:MAG: acetate kinase [Spirochaetales bacterium]|nr:acetate kinase [Spirochaetales bacterium]